MSYGSQDIFKNTHRGITNLVNHGMVKSLKTWISWERNITRTWNEKVLNLCFRWHILRSYHFVAGVTFKHLQKCNHSGTLTGFLFLKSHSHVLKKFFICFNDSPSKMMKNAFYFILKALFVLKIFKFSSWLFGHVEKTAWLRPKYTTWLIIIYDLWDSLAVLRKIRNV